jgi:hypothetical protein
MLSPSDPRNRPPHPGQELQQRPGESRKEGLQAIIAAHAAIQPLVGRSAGGRWRELSYTGQYIVIPITLPPLVSIHVKSVSITRA